MILNIPNDIPNKNKKVDFAIYSVIIAGAVILGVFGRIYYSIDKK